VQQNADIRNGLVKVVLSGFFTRGLTYKSQLKSARLKRLRPDVRQPNVLLSMSPC